MRLGRGVLEQFFQAFFRAGGPRVRRGGRGTDVDRRAGRRGLGLVRGPDGVAVQRVRGATLVAGLLGQLLRGRLLDPGLLLLGRLGPADDDHDRRGEAREEHQPGHDVRPEPPVPVAEAARQLDEARLAGDDVAVLVLAVGRAVERRVSLVDEDRQLAGRRGRVENLAVIVPAEVGALLGAAIFVFEAVLVLGLRHAHVEAVVDAVLVRVRAAVGRRTGVVGALIDVVGDAVVVAVLDDRILLAAFCVPRVGGDHLPGLRALLELRTRGGGRLGRAAAFEALLARDGGQELGALVATDGRSRRSGVGVDEGDEGREGGQGRDVLGGHRGVPLLAGVDGKERNEVGAPKRGDDGQGEPPGAMPL